MTAQLSLSDGEWKLMNLLWQDSPLSVSAMTLALSKDTGWDNATVLVMLRRMEKKGAVRIEQTGRSKSYFPAVERDGVALAETRSFLHKVYGGSVGLLVNSLVSQNALSQQDIDQLYDILKKAEEEAK